MSESNANPAAPVDSTRLVARLREYAADYEMRMTGFDILIDEAADRIEEMEIALTNIYMWTGSKRCARECKRVMPDVAHRLSATKQVNLK